MPSVFISYSHDNSDPSHAEKAAGLAAALMANGLKVFFDQNRGDEEEGVPWPIWMENKIDEADTVLLVCTKLYLDKVQQKVGMQEGLGVCWEANLIYNHLYQAKLNTTKFLPVLFSSADRNFIPGPLKGGSSVVVDSNEAFTHLYAVLTNQHRKTFPIQGATTATLPTKTVAPLFTLVAAAEPPKFVSPIMVSPVAPKRKFVLKPDLPPQPRKDVRGLDWYEECDAQHFLGRDDDTTRLLAMLLSKPVIRLIGPSGVGKSSLIRAGLLPKIREIGWRACVLRPFEDPARRLPEQLTESLLAQGDSFTTPLDPAILRQELSSALSTEGTKRLVLLLDQFEDTVSPSAAPEAVDAMRLWLRELWEHADSTPSLRVIVVYRTDADARLGRLWQEVTGRAEGLPYLSVEGISQAVAEKIIRQTAAEQGWKITAKLPEITRQLATESQKLGCSGAVFPVYLQMLLKQMADKKDGCLSADFLESVGGMVGLIGRYLERSLEQLTARGGDWAHCGKVLECLSRCSGTKSSLSLEELVWEAGLSRAALGEMLPVLVHERLVRPIGHQTYEIQHDRLAAAVIEAMKDSDREAKQAREFLAAKVPFFERTLNPLSQLELANLYRHRHSIRPNVRELAVILASWLNSHQNDEEAPALFWFSNLESEGWLPVVMDCLRWNDRQSGQLDYPEGWESSFPAAAANIEWESLSKDQSWTVRLSICLWINQERRPDKLHLLRELAKDTASDVRREAVTAIGTFHQDQDLPLLRELAKDTASDVRREAVTAIGTFHQDQDLPLLRELAKDKEWQVCIEAVKAIGTFHQDQALPLLRELAKDKEWRVRMEAVKAIGTLHQDQDLPLLRELGKNTASDVRREAVKAIGTFHQDQDLPLLRELAKDKEWQVRREAVEAIGTFHQDQALPLLRELAKDSASDVRREAVRAIGTLHQDQELPLLRELAKDKVWRVRLEAVEAIGTFHQDQALPLLRELANDKEWQVRLEAVKAIGTFLQDQALPLLRELANDKEWQVRMEAVKAIGTFHQDQDLPLLRELAKDKEWQVRMEAVKAIGTFLQDQDLPLLRELAKDSDSDVRREAVKAIGTFLQDQDLPLVRELAKDDDDSISAAAGEALTKMWSRDELEAFLADQELVLGVGALAVLDRFLYLPEWLKKSLHPDDEQPQSV